MGKSFFVKRGLLFTMLMSITFIIFNHPMFSKADTSTDSNSVYLSDIEWKDATGGKGEVPSKDTAANGNPIVLADNNGKPAEFNKGIGTLADSEIVYDISDLDYKYLTTWVGADKNLADENSSVQFEIYVDDELEYESDKMKDAKPMEYSTVKIADAQELTLVVKSTGSDNDTDYGDWADIQLHKTNPVKSNTEDIKEYENMDLVFNDEFNSSEIDMEKWGFATAPENGSHHYANKVGEDENIWIKDGNLNIRANEYEGNDDYKSTSGAVATENKFSFRYGRVDVRAKVPAETGMWPAIWMMPENPDYEWPMDGEIDIMELISQEPNKIYSTLHSGIANDSDYYFNEGGTITQNRGTYYDDYHIYSMEWEPTALKFYVDDQLVYEENKWENWVIDSNGDVKERDFPAPFNQEYYLKLNVATGGGWAEDVDETTRWGDRTTMKVDYVRVYQDKQSVSNIADLINIVNHYNNAGDLDEESYRALEIHLEALKLYEEKGKNEKLVKHLNNLVYLLDHQNKGEQISKEAYKDLKSGTEEYLNQLD